MSKHQKATRPMNPQSAIRNPQSPGPRRAEVAIHPVNVELSVPMVQINKPDGTPIGGPRHVHMVLTLRQSQTLRDLCDGLRATDQMPRAVRATHMHALRWLLDRLGTALDKLRNGGQNNPGG